ncbi:hypothetical protein [Limisalsivibrio acetivorans]|uniref:hypothetical protein n=1 Tax=Limisalsivibrio acetivorans TaxID=1304888 RepID=UPI0003B58FA8|nr:hypothetical protein [Limisalsivibrio acetivorans]
MEKGTDFLVEFGGLREDEDFRSWLTQQPEAYSQLEEIRITSLRFNKASRAYFLKEQRKHFDLYWFSVYSRK